MDSLAIRHWLYRHFIDDTQGLHPAQLRQKRNKAIFVSSLSALICIFAGWTILQGPLQGLPSESVLRALSGRVVSVTEAHNPRMASDIYVILSGVPGRFVYIPKAGGSHASVKDAICLGCAATLWVDSTDDHPTKIIFQLAVGGHMIRSYGDVEKSWAANNGLAVWVEIIFVFSMIYCAAYAFRVQRRLNEW